MFFGWNYPYLSYYTNVNDASLVWPYLALSGAACGIPGVTAEKGEWMGY
jgi:hypothetical protein